MSASHGKDIGVLIGAYNLTSYFKSLAVNRTADTAETTTFGSAAKKRIPGLLDGTVALAGVWDGAVSAVDERLNAILGVANTVFSAAWAGLAVGGGRAVLANVIETKYDVTGSLSEAVMIAAELHPSDGIVAGFVALPLAGYTTSGDTTGSYVDLGAPGTGFVAHQHVTAITGTSTPTIASKIQHSADHSTWADLAGGGFTTANALAAERLTGTLTVNRYIAIVYTITGGTPTITAAVAFAKV